LGLWWRSGPWAHPSAKSKHPRTDTDTDSHASAAGANGNIIPRSR
jgi:hypothetical protein